MQILIVEDDKSIKKQWVKILDQLQHTPVWAQDSRNALEIMDSTPVDMVVAKRIMPDINGLELCKSIRTRQSGHYIHLMLAVDQDAPFDVSQVLQCGANDYTVIPFDLEQVRIQLVLAHRIIALERELTQKFSIIKRNYFQTIAAFVQLLETANSQLGSHCRRVGTLSLLMAKQHPKMNAEERPIVEAAALLHDIGLIGLPESIVNKKRTELNGEETVLFRSHSQRGEDVLSQMDMLKPVARLVGMHHEQCNGRGFPKGLSKEQIPLGARIIAAASIYDDLVHREQVDWSDIPQILQQYRGYQIEPNLVEMLLQVNLNMMQEEARKDEIPLYLDELKDGMILARDVIMKSGAFVMSAGTSLDLNIIEKLKRYHESGNIMDKIYIKKL